MKPRTGIFDPWRDAPEEEAKEEPAAPDDLTPVELRCVRFGGLRAGISVWVDGLDDDDGHRGREVLVELVFRLYQVAENAKIFESWRVKVSNHTETDTLVISGKNRMSKVLIGFDPKDKRFALTCIDSLALALREISDQNKEAKALLTTYRVEPYIK